MKEKTCKSCKHWVLESGENGLCFSHKLDVAVRIATGLDTCCCPETKRYDSCNYHEEKEQGDERN